MICQQIESSIFIESEEVGDLEEKELLLIL